jgi:hypothetical protein
MRTLRSTYLSVGDILPHCRRNQKRISYANSTVLKHLYLIILLTFVTGLATGIFGYFMTRDTTDVETDSGVEVQEEETGYEILVTVYGGCARVGCASFRLLDDGSYTYLAPEGVRDYARYEDVISERQLEELSDLLNTTNLERVAETTYEGMCPVTYDGIAYRFDIREQSERYSFDSCVENLDSEPLFLELVKYIDIMEATHNTP